MTTVTPEGDSGLRGAYLGAARKRQRVVDECEWFLAWTTTGAEEMASRLGIQVDSLHVALTSARRCGRPDLWRRLRDRDIRAGRVEGVNDDQFRSACDRYLPSERGAA